MLIYVPKEIFPNENRTPLIPASIGKLVENGASIAIQSGLGISAGYFDEDYKKVGAEISTNHSESLKKADLILRLRKPPLEDIDQLKEGAIHVSFLDPLNEKELVDKLKAKKISAISMEFIPRTTRAQKMDALSSQASLGGYVAVVLAARRIDKVFPMMMTPAGTIAPTRVFIIGVGVAGLQAIATAKRLGARVEAFDTRPVVEEQVQSLGAKFVKVDLGETGQTKDGYAKALTKEQLEKQREMMAKHCAMADIVITTAQIFGRKAPVIVTNDMVKNMKNGSVIVDMAVESGGNVEPSELNKEVNIDGVRIIGLGNLPGEVAVHASQMYSANLQSLISEFWDKDAKKFNLDLEDEIIDGCLITHKGEIVNQMVKDKLS